MPWIEDATNIDPAGQFAKDDDAASFTAVFFLDSPLFTLVLLGAIPKSSNQNQPGL